jgi:cytochrome c-type biogenesis protein CcmH/NrfF
MFQSSLTLVLTLPIVLFLAGIVSAQHADDTERAPLTEQQEQRAKRLETQFIAPCCWHQPVSDHSSQVSKQMKAEIRSMIANGLSDREIHRHYIVQYGERIMAVPPGAGFNRLVWIVPVIAGVFGLSIAGHLLRSWRSKDDASDIYAEQRSAPASHQKVDAQLREWTD